MSAVDLTAHLDNVIDRGNGQYLFSCGCGLHKRGDKNRSGSAKQLPDGRWLIHCFAGGSPSEILAAVGLSMSDLFPDRPEPSRGAGRSQHRLSHRDALRLLRREAMVAAVAARAVADGDVLSEDNLRRVNDAAVRIALVVDMAGVPEQ